MATTLHILKKTLLKTAILDGQPVQVCVAEVHSNWGDFSPRRDVLIDRAEKVFKDNIPEYITFYKGTGVQVYRNTIKQTSFLDTASEKLEPVGVLEKIDGRLRIIKK